MSPFVCRAVGMTLLAVGCTDRNLFETRGLGEGPIDNKLAVRSSICTVDPTLLDFPVKILFAVDTSQSMVRTDPTGRRLIAVADVVDTFITEPGVEFAIIQFSGAANTLTQDENGEDGFTRDREEIDNAIVRLGLAEQPTDYEGALSQIFRVLSNDMMNTDEETLSRSKYVIIFLSDGLPNPVDPPNNTRSSILERVAEIKNLERVFRPAEIRIHTALVLGAIRTGFRCTDSDLEGGQGRCEQLATAATCAQRGDCVWIGVGQEAESLLGAMSEAGGGTFRSFANGEEINFLRVDFTSVRRVFSLKNLLVSNTNARPSLRFSGPADRVGRARSDSDGDGLDDLEEDRVGANPGLADTDGDGFGDFLEVRLSASGFDPLDPSDADCPFDLDRIDTDGDGLLDCEERFVGSSRFFVDTDADGIPDFIELVAGTNPVAADDRLDLDFDGAENGVEVRGHSDPLTNDAAKRSSGAYRYNIIQRSLASMADDDPRRSIVADGRLCYDFRIENVTLAETQPSGRNRIYVYVAQAPFDDPTDRGVFQIACVEQSFVFPDFRNPPFPEVEIPRSAFMRPADFDPDVDCTTGFVGGR